MCKMLLKVLFRAVPAVVIFGLVWKIDLKNIQPKYSRVHDYNKNI